MGQCRGRNDARPRTAATPADLRTPARRPPPPAARARLPSGLTRRPARRLLPARAVSAPRRRPHSTWLPAPGRTARPWRRHRARAPRMRPCAQSSHRASRGAPARPPRPGCPDAGATLPVAARRSRRQHDPPEPKEEARYEAAAGRVSGGTQRGRQGDGPWDSWLVAGVRGR